MRYISVFLLLVILSLGGSAATSYNVTVGSTFEIAVADFPEVYGITQFDKKPKVYITGGSLGVKTKQANVLTKIFPATDKIKCEWKSKVPPGTYTLVVILNNTSGKSLPIEISTSFAVEGPQIDSITPDSGGVSTTITVTGQYFGAGSLPSISLYIEENCKRSACKIDKEKLNYLDVRGKPSCMEPGSGASEIVFTVPKKISSDTKAFLYVNNKIGFDYRPFNNAFKGKSMILVEKGEFIMGGDGGYGSDYKPPHPVYVSDFYLDKFEMTNEQVRGILQWAYQNGKIIFNSKEKRMDIAGSSGIPLFIMRYSNICFSNEIFSVTPGASNYPCFGVTWYGAMAFCNYLGEMEGIEPCINLSNWTCDFMKPGYRLPTEAEWEKACRAGTTTEYFWGDSKFDAPDYSWCEINSKGKCHPVGELLPNPWNFHDITGNLSEWIYDYFSEYYYSISPYENPQGPATGTKRALRGSSFDNLSYLYLPSYYRKSAVPQQVSENRGFRIAKSGVNEAPLAHNTFITVRKDSPQDIVLIGTSVNPSAVLAYAISLQPVNGVLSGFEDGDGKGRYIPASGFTGEDSFSFKVSDGISESAEGTVSISVWNALGGMVNVGEGSFDMGDSFDEASSDELPVHSVTTSEFLMGSREVVNKEVCDVFQWAYDNGRITVSEYSGTVSSGDTIILSFSSTYSGIKFSEGKFTVSSGKENLPVVGITWYGAMAFCSYLNEMDGREQCVDLDAWTCDFSKKGYRPPTEAEWEKAARGTLKNIRFPFGQTISHSFATYYAHKSLDSGKYDINPTSGYNSEYGKAPAPAGSFRPNFYGLLDMAGNVAEWCYDYYGYDYYEASPSDNPRGPADGTSKVFRSGSFKDGAGDLRVASRNKTSPGTHRDSIGFRVVIKK